MSLSLLFSVTALNKSNTKLANIDNGSSLLFWETNTQIIIKFYSTKDQIRLLMLHEKYMEMKLEIHF